MGSEGYFINEFLAPRTNQRTRRVGRLARESRAARAGDRARRRARPWVRDSSSSSASRGSTWWKAAAPARKWSGSHRRWKAPAPRMLNTGIGWHEARVPTIAGIVPRGAFGWVSARIKAATRLPVIATNRFNAPDGAEALLASGDADLVSMARPLLADPDLPRKARRRTRERDQHLHRLQPGLSRPRVREQARHLSRESAGGVRDGVAHRVRRRHRSASPWSAPGPRASPAPRRSPNAAIASRCSSARAEIGGQFRYAREVPGKEDFHDTLRYFARRIELTGVTLAAEYRGRRAQRWPAAGSMTS